MTTSADAGEAQPDALVTVYKYIPGNKPDIVVSALIPAIVPGLRIQPPAGKPLNVTLPVATAHVGWVMMPTIGAAGVAG